MKRTTRWLIGCAAGLCLALVRLVEAQFFFGYSRAAVLVGVFTAVAFTVMAGIFTAFLDEPQPAKLFLQGLVAPSFLIAVVHGHATPGAEASGSQAQIPQISSAAHAELDNPEGPLASLFSVQIAYAQTPDTKVQQPREAIRTVAVRPWDGALAFFGTDTPQRSFAYIVGQTTDTTQAVAIVNQLRAVVAYSVVLLRPVGSNRIYIVVGGITTAIAARQAKQDALLKLSASLKRGKVSANSRVAQFLLDGPVVDTRQILVP